MSRPPARPQRRPLSLIPPLLAALAIVSGGALAPDWSEALFTAGVYRASWGLAQGIDDAARARASLPRWIAAESLLFYREGLHGVVSVHEQRSDPSIITLKFNGKPDASTSIDIATQMAAGDLPMMWAPANAEVCVVGLGSGVTVRSVLTHDPRSVQVVEIEPAVVAASRFFDSATDTVLADPRVHLTIEDGRQHLARSGRTYDVIVSEPSNPWIAGVNNLFTVDFYHRVQQALRPAGVFCQWVQLYELSPQAAASLVGSFAHVFPDAEAFLIWTTGDLLLVAPPEGARVPAERLLTGPEFARARFFARHGVHSTGASAAYHIGTVSTVAAQLGRAPLNTDDRPYVEYRAPFDLYRVPEQIDPLRLAEPHPLHGLARWLQPEALPQAAIAAGEHLIRVGIESRAQALLADLEAAGPEFAGTAVAVREAEARTRREAGAQAWFARATEAFEGGDAEAAEAALEQVFAIAPEHASGHLLHARIDIMGDHITPARRHLELALGSTSAAVRCDAYNLLGVLAMRERRLAQGRRFFEAARRADPRDPNAYVNLARWHLESERVDSAEVVLRRGIAQAEPPHPVQRAYRALESGEIF